MQNKTEQLRLDIVNDAPIQGSATFLDTRKIEFYNHVTGKPMEVAMYAIIDGTLRVWIEEREWNESELSVSTPAQIPERNTKISGCEPTDSGKH